MIKKFLLLFLISFSVNAQDQNASVEKSVFGVQTGLFGLYVNNEARLTDEIALRSEIGLDLMVAVGGLYDSNTYALAPVITLEPRWYYNLEKRIAKGRNIINNSGNFISVKSDFHPSWFAITSNDNLIVRDQISIAPTWGIRRHIGQHFNYEVAAGAGWGHIFPTKYKFSDEGSYVAVNLHLRIGYTF